MSDPVTNVEIEDVLSSIRRLVSQGETPASQAESSKKTPEPEPAPAKALVLTPALRILESDPEPAPDSTPAPAISENTPISEQDEDLYLGGLEFDETAPLQDEMTEPAWDIEPEPEVGGPSDHDNAAVDPAPDAPGFDDDARAHIIWENGEAHVETTSGNRADLLATIAELEAAVGAQPDEWESDVGETAPKAKWSPQTDTSVARIHPNVEAAQNPTTPVDEVAEAAAPRALFDTDISNVQPIPLTNPVVAGAPVDHGVEPMDDFEPPQDLADDADLAAYLDGEGVIDEEMLRELVSDIVREELQGALGERITRNVRKLVRREIYRILSSQNFD